MAGLRLLKPGSGLVQLSSGEVIYQLSSVGSALLTDSGETRPQPVVQATVTVTGTNPILAWRAQANNDVTLFAVSVSGSSHTYTFRCTSLQPVGLVYWAFDVAGSAGAYIGGPRMQAWTDQGVKTFDSRAFAMDFKGFYENPDEGYGSVVSQPAGRTYAVIQSLYGYVQRNVNLGQYTDNPNDSTLIPPGTPDEPQPGQDTHYLNQGEGYQPTARFSPAGNSVEVGMTLFEQFVSWQPMMGQTIPNGVVNRVASGRAGHTIIDVTNLPSAEMPSQGSLAVSASASVREVSMEGSGATYSVTPAVSVTPSGGTAPYVYSWERVSGSASVVANGSTTSSSFSTQATVTGTAEAIYRCRVSDQEGRVGYSPNITFRHVITVVDLVPNTLTLSPLTFASNLNQAATSDICDITGINRAITLRVERYNMIGSIDAARVYVYTGPTAGQNGPFTFVGEFDPRGTAQAFVDFVVQPNSRLHYVIDSVTYEGRKDYAFDLVVWNMSSGPTQLSNKRINITVDADNNWNIADITPTLTWINGSVRQDLVTNDYIGTSNAIFAQVTGINRTIGLKTYVSADFGPQAMDGGICYVRRSSVGSGGPWTDVGYLYLNPEQGGQVCDYTVNNNDWLYIQTVGETCSGRRRGQYNLNTHNMTQSSVLNAANLVAQNPMDLTVDADDNYYAPDFTPNPISVPNISNATNEPTLYTDLRLFQVTGINQTTYLRFIRPFANLSQSGNIFTRRLLVRHSTTGSGGPWAEYFVGAGNVGNPMPFTDVAVNNGDWIYVQGLVDTTSGVASASWLNHIDYHDGVTVLGRLASFTIAGTVDADNNFNIPDDFTINPISHGNLNFNTGSNYGGIYSPSYQITGINQPCTLRITISNVTTNMAGGTLYFLLAEDHGNTTYRRDISYTGGPVSVTTPAFPGMNFMWLFDGATDSGIRSATFDVTITNESAGAAIVTQFSCGGIVDNDNNFNLDADPDAISFSTVNGYNGNGTTVTQSSPTYTMTGFATPVTMRTYFGVYNHFFNQSSAGGVIQAGDGPTSGQLTLNMFRNGGYAGTVSHSLYGSYNGAEQYQVLDLVFNPGETVRFEVVMSGDISEGNKGLEASTTGGIYFDRIGGARLGAFTHQMGANKAATQF